MAKINLTGFRANGIRNLLARDLLLILADFLSNTRTDLQDFNSRDELDLMILALLSQRHYVNELLFRDFSRTQEELWYSIREGQNARRIHVQAPFYYYEVLGRPLTLANRLKDQPTNMHLLLESFCQYGHPAWQWQDTTIARNPAEQPRHEDTLYFRHTAQCLARLLKQPFGEISQRRRREYGPLWLKAGSSTTEVPEELSLFKVMDALPLPLTETFANDQELQRRFCAVIASLNERFSYLRSCGLDPEQWLERIEPPVGNLKDMASLRRAVQQQRQEEGSDNELANLRRCFNRLKGDKPKFAGCSDLDELVTTEWGAILLRGIGTSTGSQPPRQTFDRCIDTQQEDANAFNALALDESNEIEDPDATLYPEDLEDEVRVLMAEHSQEFKGKPLMSFVLLKVLAKGLTLEDVEQDDEFQQLLQARTHCLDMAIDKRNDRIRRELHEIIQRLQTN